MIALAANLASVADTFRDIFGKGADKFGGPEAHRECFVLGEGVITRPPPWSAL